jgi:hypothetical protein
MLARDRRKGNKPLKTLCILHFANMQKRKKHAKLLQFASDKAKCAATNERLKVHIYKLLPVARAALSRVLRFLPERRTCGPRLQRKTTPLARRCANSRTSFRNEVAMDLPWQTGFGNWLGCRIVRF